MRPPTARPSLRSALAGSLLVCALCPQASAQSTPEAARPLALSNVALGVGEDAARGTVLLSGGRIESILDAAAEIPPGVRVIDGDGLVALPAFLDVYTTEGCETPRPEADQDKPASVRSSVLIDMREANRKGVQPAFRAADVLTLSEDAAKAYRAQGFGLFCASPRGETLSGTSVLATTRDAAARDMVVRGDVFAQAAFTARGGGYPGTLMGYHAQLRQFFLDAQRHAVLKERYLAGQPGPRPPHDPDLDAGLELLAGERTLLCEAQSGRDIERWVRLADEFGLKIAISGGREAFEVAELLAERDIPVLLTLDWGREVEDPDKQDKKKKKGKDEEESDAAAEDDPEEAEDAEPEDAAPEAVEAAAPVAEQGDDEASDESGDEEGSKDEPELDWTYEEPLEVRREKRRVWEEKRDGARVLHEAGVRFAFTSGTASAKDLLGKVRTLCENGLPNDVALRALTQSPAELLGLDARVGKLAAGYDALVSLWTDDPTAKDAQVAWLVVDGIPYEFEIKKRKKKGGDGPPAEGVDLSGTWVVEFQGERERAPADLELAMAEDGTVTGSYTSESRFSEEPLTGEIRGKVSGKEVSLTTSVSFGEMDMELVFEGTFEDGKFSGEMQMKSSRFERTSPYTAKPKSQGAPR